MSRWPEVRAALNITHLQHVIYALLMQAVIGILSGDWWAGACFGAAFFLGREHAQAQSALGLGDFIAFDMRRWSRDSQLDFLCPLLAVAAVVFVQCLGGFSS